MIDWVVSRSDTSIMLRVAEDDWAVTVWEPNGIPRIYCDDNRTAREWPHGIRALARFLLCCHLVEDGAWAYDEVEAATTRLVATLPDVCGVDWVAPHERPLHAFGFAIKCALRIGRE